LILADILVQRQDLGTKPETDGTFPNFSTNGN
jgi:hypothetical protein